MRRTKIVCTLGPACNNEQTLAQMLKNGMNVARLNFSHGTHEYHKANIEMFRKVRDEMKVPAAIMLDTKGPEIRVGNFKNGAVTLKSGDTFTFTTRETEGNEKEVGISYKELPAQLSPGNEILVDDGKVLLRVTAVTDTDITCEVVTGGVISNHKGVNIPNVHLDFPHLSEQDEADLRFGVEMNVDFVAASFVRSKEDVIGIRNCLDYYGGYDIKIISKIENIEGVEHFDEILEHSDGIMVARGDMGVEIEYEKLPGLQKKFIKKCYQAGKMVITATQMLESMIHNPRPTRAEISDVANAVYDGTSAIMLSGETAAGKYPVEAVKTMAKIAESTEKNINYGKRFYSSEFKIKSTVDAISHATCGMAIDIGAKAIVACSLSGMTARMVSRFRSPVDIIGLTTDENTWHRLALSWGVIPAMCETFTSTDVLFYTAKKIAEQTLPLSKGDHIVITGGVPGESGATTLIKIETV